jgi:hypothetical protein
MDRKELSDYLKKRRYEDLENAIFPDFNRLRDTKSRSKTQERRESVKAIQRFQTFSGLKATGRLNKQTHEEIDKPRCSFPDIGYTELLLMNFTAPRWPTTNIPFAIRNFSEQLPVPVTRTILTAAFAEWRRVFPPFVFPEVDLDDNPLVNVSFVVGNHQDGFSFRAGDGDLGHAFLPNHPTLRGEVHFDNSERWSVSNPATSYDLLTVAIHEIGHTLGLVHSTNRDSLMFATYLGLRRHLHTEDVNNIRNLYG